MLITKDWDDALKDEFTKPYFKELMKKTEEAYATTTVFPPRHLVFEALKMTDYNDVKVVILGQDPYHNAGQANGLAFAVNEGVAMPPSLKNIFAEIESDTGKKPENNTTLLGWAKQGVLLLNTTLTVREGVANSHVSFGWDKLTDAIIVALGQRERPTAYILWGNNARAKQTLVGRGCFSVRSAHPSPLSASRGFFGSKPFSKVNNFLISIGTKPVDWSRTGDDFLPSYYGGKITII